MILSRIIIKLRVFLTLSLVLGIGTLFGGIYYLNAIGLNDKMRDRISKELEHYGIYMECDTLRYSLNHGLTAENVSIYRSSKRRIRIAKLPSLIINIDKTKLIRGKLKINTIELANAELDIPLIANDDHSPQISITQACGLIDFPGESGIKTNKLTGLFEGIRITVSCDIWRSKPLKKKKPDPEIRRAIAQRYQAFLNHLNDWQWSADSPPHILLTISGDISTSSQLKCRFAVDANNLTYQDFTMQSVLINGGWQDQLLTIDDYALTHDGTGIKGIADYDFLLKNGRYKIHSTLHPKEFARKTFKKSILKSLVMSGETELDAEGSFALPTPENAALSIKMTGHAKSHNFSYNGININSLESDFSWNDGNLYLNNLLIDHPAGTLTGRVIILEDIIRYDARSNLPAKEYIPLLNGEIVRDILRNTDFEKDADIALHAKGSINRHDLHDWTSTGNAEVTRCSYNGVPLKKLQGHYRLDNTSGDFTQIKATFDYAKYPMRKKFNGPDSGHLQADKVSFSSKNATVQIDGLRGTAWPAPVLRMFHKATADHLEHYQFQQPPNISASGLIGILDDSPPTKFSCGFSNPGTTRYHFLGKDVRLQNIQGQVSIIPGKVRVTQLKAKAFNGPISGHVHVDLNGDDSHYSGRFQWQNLSLTSIGKTYDIEKADKGYLTGAFTFRGIGESSAKLNGHGNISLSGANLFSIPVLGPLSILVDAVLSPIAQQKLLHEQATNASCLFTMKNGVLITHDLSSITQNMTFTGEGWVDLNREIIDLTIRMNFRGVLGLAEIPMKVIELPLQALRTVFTGKQVHGMRQFHGTGKLNDPQWRYTPFQPPRDIKNDPIFRKPPVAEVVE